MSSVGNGFSIAAIVCGLIALLFFPIVFGPVGLVLAGVGLSRKERRAPVAMCIAGIGTVTGMVIGFLVVSSMYG